LKFHTGKVYRYFEFPAPQYEEFLNIAGRIVRVWPAAAITSIHAEAMLASPCRVAAGILGFGAAAIRDSATRNKAERRSA